MSLLTFIPATRRRRRKRRQQMPSAGLSNTILHVRFTVDFDIFAVELNHPLFEAGAAAQMLEISANGSVWVPAQNVIPVEESPFVQFYFATVHPEATLWRVPVATQWIFADGATLEAPYSGPIEDE